MTNTITPGLFYQPIPFTLEEKYPSMSRSTVYRHEQERRALWAAV
jgi:hypothetical protein